MSPMLTGIIPPLVTPLLDRDTLDVRGLDHLIDRVLSGGVSGLFLLGTTGEGASLSYRLRRPCCCRRTSILPASGPAGIAGIPRALGSRIAAAAVPLQHALPHQSFIRTRNFWPVNRRASHHWPQR